MRSFGELLSPGPWRQQLILAIKVKIIKICKATFFFHFVAILYTVFLSRTFYLAPELHRKGLIAWFCLGCEIKCFTHLFYGDNWVLEHSLVSLPLHSSGLRNLEVSRSIHCLLDVRMPRDIQWRSRKAGRTLHLSASMLSVPSV